MTEGRARRRPHPAAAGRALVAGVAAAGTIGMVAAMAVPAEGSTSPDDATVAPSTSEPAPQSTSGTTIVVVRHHPASAAATSGSPSSPTLPPVASATIPRAPASPPVAATPTSPPTTQTRGS